MTTLDKIRLAIKQETGETEVTPDTRLRTLVTDSLEMVSLVQALEDALEKDIDDIDAQQLFTVQDVMQYAEAH